MVACWCIYAICLDSSSACLSVVLSGLRPLPGSSNFGRGTLGVFFFFYILQLYACCLSSSLPEPPASFNGGSAAWLCETSIFFSLQWSLWPASRLGCLESGHSVSNLSVFADCLFTSMAWELLTLSVSSVKVNRSMLSAILIFSLPWLREHHVLQVLLQFLDIGWLPCPQWSLLWVWVVVLLHLFSSDSELLEFFSFRALIGMTLFLVALATATRLDELQALSKCVS